VPTASPFKACLLAKNPLPSILSKFFVSRSTIVEVGEEALLYYIDESYIYNRINHKEGPRARVWKKNRMKHLGASKLRIEGVWCCVCFLLFLVIPSFDTLVSN